MSRFSNSARTTTAHGRSKTRQGTAATRNSGNSHTRNSHQPARTNPNSQGSRVSMVGNSRLSAKGTQIAQQTTSKFTHNATASNQVTSQAVVDTNTTASSEPEYVVYQEAFLPTSEIAVGQEYKTGVVTLEIAATEQDRRIDNFLISILPAIPKSTFYRLLRKGEIRVNKKRTKPEYKLQAGDQVRIAPLTLVHQADKTAALKSLSKLNNVQHLLTCIVYEDKDLIIVNKPVGVAVHGGSGLSYGVIEALRAAMPREKRLELVHRIDRETSGLLMIAKKPSVLKALQDQFRFKTIQKSYYCLVPGYWTASQVNQPLRRYEKNGERFVEVHDEGKASITNYQVVKHYRDHMGHQFSLLIASPKTGRTHQIRVHCMHELAALAGDLKYSTIAEQSYFKSIGLNRMFLHAFKLDFTHPVTGEHQIIEIELPWELQCLLHQFQEII